MFQTLEYKSPMYEAPGGERFRFFCRYPTTEEILGYEADVARILEKYRDGKPSDGPNAEAAAARRRGIAETAGAAALKLVSHFELNEETDPAGWREHLESPDRPGFLSKVLWEIGLHLFRGATEASSDGSEPAA